MNARSRDIKIGRIGVEVEAEKEAINQIIEIEKEVALKKGRIFLRKLRKIPTIN